jgi:hypothetical protein
MQTERRCKHLHPGRLERGHSLRPGLGVVGLVALPYLGTLLTLSTTPTDLAGYAAGMLALAIPLVMFAPMIAALIMRLFVSKDGVKGSIGLWRSWNTT